MTEQLPAATAVRSTWAQLPAPVRSAVEDRLGARVLGAASQGSGFTDGVAARLTLAGGRRAFVKALATGHELTPDYRREARIAAALPAPVPASRLRFSLETAGWHVLAYEDIEGRHPDLGRAGDLAAVLTCVEELGRTLTPNPLPWAPSIGEQLGGLYQGWRLLLEEEEPGSEGGSTTRTGISNSDSPGTATGAPTGLDPWSARHLHRLAELESRWPVAATGDTLLHADLRQDNLLLTADGRAVAVDWAWACVGADWVELVFLLPAVAAAGGDPQEIVTTHPVTRGADPAAIDAFVCALAGFYTHSGRQPSPLWSPHLRTFERRYGELCRAWLARRTGWS
ncbi:phosphotransferase family protein [Streptomyces sp. NPDC051567]|uniref:phosphotransferase family protein n=1 Tax=Streptomyces sp. NPDC051567 TaxID=3365660 RepID=UPI0037A9956A